MTLQELQDRMIKYRAKERINQTEFAERCGLSLQTISCIENGIQKPSPVTLAKIELVINKEV